MDAAHFVFLFLAVGVIAFLYSSVGHAGASGYIAVMALWGLAPTVIRPTALVLNKTMVTHNVADYATFLALQSMTGKRLDLHQPEVSPDMGFWSDSSIASTLFAR